MAARGKPPAKPDDIAAWPIVPESGNRIKIPFRRGCVGSDLNFSDVQDIHVFSLYRALPGERHA